METLDRRGVAPGRMPKRGEIVRVNDHFSCIVEVIGFWEGHWHVRTALPPAGQVRMLEHSLVDTGRCRAWSGS